MKKTLVTVLALLVLASALLTGCTDTGKTPAEKIAAGEAVKIGVIQYLSHASLDNCYAGIEQAIKQSGIKYELDFQMGSNTSAEADCAAFANTMVADNCDIIIAIATPAAIKAYAATADTDIPVIFCAVSDPVEAKLVADIEQPGGNCTGTSDVLDLEAQVDLICALQPDVQTIGVLYTSSEANSIANLRVLREICSKREIAVDAVSVQNANDISSAAATLAARVDCINNFTDNNVVNNLGVLLAAADANGIPVYGSEIEQVKRGCIAAVSIDYVALGKVTGAMAVDALKGKPCGTTPVRTIKDATPVLNSDVLTRLNITAPAIYNSAERVTTE